MAVPPRVYDAKCLVANWYDARKEPSFPGVRPSVITETQIRNAETLHVPTPTYGGALKSTYAHIKSIEDDFDYSNLVYPDRRYNGASSASITSTAHFGRAAKLDTADFSSSYRLGGPAVARDPKLLAAYRTEHTTDKRGAYAVTERFTSSAVISTTGLCVPQKFQPITRRALPGCAKSIDIILAKAMDKFGWDAPLRLRLALPPTFDKLVLRACVAKMGLLPLSANEEKELMRELCESPEGHEMVAEREALLSRILNTTPPTPAREAAVEAAWERCVYVGSLRGEVQGVQGQTPSHLTMGAILQCLDSSLHPDCRKKPALKTAQTSKDSTWEGISAIARLLVSPPTPILSPLKSEASAATPWGNFTQSNFSQTALPQALDGSIVSRTMSTSVPLPLGTSRRVDNGDFLLVKNTLVGVPGKMYNDPAAGKGGEPGAHGADACLNWGVGFLGRSKSDEAGVRKQAEGEARAVGAPPLTPAEKLALSAHNQGSLLLQPPLPLDAHVSREAFHVYFSYHSPSTPCDDTFVRMLQTLFYSDVRPSVPSSFLGPLTEGVQAPDRSRGPPTEHSQIGKGLAYAPKPYNPKSRRMPPPQAPTFSDPDAAFAQGDVDSVAILVTHVGGRKSVERVARDRFMPLPKDSAQTEGELLVRLHKAGVVTAVGASLAAF